MKINEVIEDQIKKMFYVVSYDKYTNEASGHELARMALKHPALRPELIVVNDQPFGFKKLSPASRSMEKFNMFCEMEHFFEDDVAYIDSFDLYAEMHVDFQDKMVQIMRLVNLYSKSVSVERMKRFNDVSSQSMLIYSRLNEFIFDFFSDEEYANSLTEPDIETNIKFYLGSFNNFIKGLAEILGNSAPAPSNDSSSAVS